MSRMWQKIWVMAALVAVAAAAHVELTTFAQIRTALQAGHHLHAVADANLCQPDLFDDTEILSVPFKVWDYDVRQQGASIAIEHSYTAFEAPFDMRHLHMDVRTDGSVHLNIAVFVPGDWEITEQSAEIVCQLGDSAKVFDHSTEVVYTPLNDYAEVKAALLAGQKVNRAVTYEFCEGGNNQFNDQTVGSSNELAFVAADGSAQEHIEFVDDEFIIRQNQIMWRSIHTNLNPDNSLFITTRLWKTGEWTVQNGVTLECTYDQASFNAEPAEDEEEMSTFADISASLKSGHELEIVVDLFSCTDDETGEPGPHRMIIEKIPVWMEFNANLIAFTRLFLRNVVPVISFEEYQVKDDETVAGRWLQINLADGSIVGDRHFTCDIGGAAKFFVDSRDRTPQPDYATVVESVTNGFHLTAVTETGLCETEGGVQEFTIGTSVFETRVTTFQSGQPEVLLEQEIPYSGEVTGTGNIIDTVTIPGRLFPDDVLVWTPAILDGQWNNLAPGWRETCTLGDGVLLWSDKDF